MECGRGFHTRNGKYGFGMVPYLRAHRPPGKEPFLENALGPSLGIVDLLMYPSIFGVPLKSPFWVSARPNFVEAWGGGLGGSVWEGRVKQRAWCFLAHFHGYKRWTAVALYTFTYIYIYI